MSRQKIFMQFSKMLHDFYTTGDPAILGITGMIALTVDKLVSTKGNLR